MNADKPTSWRPLLTGPTAERALQAAVAIAEDLRRIAGEEIPLEERGFRGGPSLAGGDAGLAFFLTYLDQVRPGEGWDDLAMERLDRAIETTGELHSAPALYGGFSGVAWTVEHLRGRLFEDDEEGEDPGDVVAEALNEHVRLTPWRGHYDLISGLVGLGVYALERMPRQGGRECLEGVVARLSELAERRPDGITWHTGPPLLGPKEIDTYPQGNYNVGVAHGVPGVIAVLGRACAAGVDARELLDGAVAWVLAQKTEGMDSLFPYNVAPGEQERRPTRLAWCYGDLGLAVSLLVAARAVGEEEWEREALSILHRAAAREADESGVMDAGVCHGGAGVAHLFNRAYQATGDETCREAALFWFGRALEQWKPGTGIGGYQMWITNAEWELDWRDDPGFLTGSAGVGLTLLAAASDVEPEWDRVLLASPL